MRGWMIGEEGKGIQEISTILNITRVHSTVASLGYLGRGIGIAKAYALVREVGVGKGRGSPCPGIHCICVPLANLTGDYHSLMLLVFYTLYVLGLDESGGGKDPDASAFMGAITLRSVMLDPSFGFSARSIRPTYASKPSRSSIPAWPHSAVLGISSMPRLSISMSHGSSGMLVFWPSGKALTDVLSSDTIRALKHPDCREGEFLMLWIGSSTRLWELSRSKSEWFWSSNNGPS